MDKQKIVELELINQKLTELDGQLRAAESQVEHAVLARNMLEEFKSATADQELLVPIGNGIFITVKAKDIHKVKMAVGANVVVDMSADDALTTIDKQLTETKQFHTQVLAAYEQVAQEATRLQQEIEAK